jgi:hypothetical protein
VRDVETLVHVECIHNTRSFGSVRSSGASPKAEQRAATSNQSNALNARRPAGQPWWGEERETIIRACLLYLANAGRTVSLTYLPSHAMPCSSFGREEFRSVVVMVLILRFWIRGSTILMKT